MLRERKRASRALAEEENAEDYISDQGDDDIEETSEHQGLRVTAKRRKVIDESYRRKCRERNREHARNTRERKKQEIDLLQARILALTEEVRTFSTPVRFVCSTMTHSDGVLFEHENWSDA